MSLFRSVIVRNWHELLGKAGQPHKKYPFREMFP